MSKSQSAVLSEGVYGVDELEEKLITPNQWGAVGAKMYKPVSVTHERLPAACYSMTLDQRDGTIVFIKKAIKSDDILYFKGGITDDFLTEVNEFWDKEESFKEHGFLHRRGYLLYGRQGTGKSSTVWQVAQDVIKRGGIVFVCDNPKFFTQGLATFRQVEPKRPVVCIFEDIDAIIAKYGEPDLLSLLDGDNQIDRVINIATTNYPERLDKRIVSRPRRFDRVYKVEVPTDVVREEFLNRKLPKSVKRAEWNKKTKGLSFAALTEVLISVLCLGNDLTTTVAILKDIESKSPKSSDFGSNIGFKNGEDDDDFDDDDDMDSIPRSTRGRSPRLVKRKR